MDYVTITPYHLQIINITNKIEHNDKLTEKRESNNYAKAYRLPIDQSFQFKEQKKSPSVSMRLHKRNKYFVFEIKSKMNSKGKTATQ